MLTFPRSTIWTVVAVGVMISAGRLCAAAQSVTVFNPSFERPVVAQGGFQLSPSAADQGAGPGDSAWEFDQSGDSGIVAQGRMFTWFGGGSYVLTPPDGNQVLFLGADGNGPFQFLTFPAAGQYTLTFDQFGAVGVSIFSQNNVRVEPSMLQLVFLPQSDFYQASLAFTIPAPGSYSLGFDNSNPSTGPQQLPPALVDNISIAPEPSCAVLLGLGLVLVRRRKSRPHWATLLNSGHHPTSRSRNPSDPDVLAQEIADDLQAAAASLA